MKNCTLGSDHTYSVKQNFLLVISVLLMLCCFLSQFKSAPLVFLTDEIQAAEIAEDAPITEKTIVEEIPATPSASDNEDNKTPTVTEPKRQPESTQTSKPGYSTIRPNS